MTFISNNRAAKAIIAIVLSLTLTCALPFSAFAASENNSLISSNPATTSTKDAPKGATKVAEDFVYDTYGLFGDSDSQRLNAIAKNLAGRYGVGVYFFTCANIGNQSVRSFAKEIYQELNLGVGNAKSGIMFLVAVESRDYVTITYGEGVHAFTDWEINEMEETIVGYLSDNEWLPAAEAYYEEAQSTLEFLDENGEPLDYDNAPKEPRSPMEYIMAIIGSLVAAGVGAGALTRGPLNAMKSAKEQDYAFAYVPNGGLQLTGQYDNYTHSTTMVVETPEPDHGSGGWGGSSVDSGGFGGSSGGKF